jgi:hypothetical protein
MTFKLVVGQENLHLRLVFALNVRRSQVALALIIFVLLQCVRVVVV